MRIFFRSVYAPILLLIPVFILLYFDVWTLLPDFMTPRQKYASVNLCGIILFIVAFIYAVVLHLINRKTAPNDSALGLMGFVTVAFFAGVLLPSSHHPPNERTLRISCISNMKQIGIALKLYSSDNNDQFPPSSGIEGLGLLVEKGYLNMMFLRCPSVKRMKPPEKLTGEYCSYEYTGGLTERDDPDSALASDKKGNHGKHYRNVLTVGGSVKSIKD